MTPKQIIAMHATLFGIFVAGFGAIWLGMQNMGHNIRSEITQVRGEIFLVRTEISSVRNELSTLSQRVARIEGHLGIATAHPSDRAASDPALPLPKSDIPARPAVDG